MLENVSAGAYATVTQVNEYTYVVTVKHGGNLVLTGIWTPAVDTDDPADKPAGALGIAPANIPGSSPAGAPAANPGMIMLKQGSEETGTAGENRVYEINMKKAGKSSVRAATLRKLMDTENLRYVVVRTAFGSFRVPVEELLSACGDTDTLTFRMNGRSLEIYLGTVLIAAFEAITA